MDKATAISELRQLFPKSWTHMSNVSLLPVAFKLKLLGIDWRSNEDFGKAMVVLERMEVFERKDYLVRRSMNHA